MAETEITMSFKAGAADFIYSVPPLTPEAFRPHIDTEEREFVQATIKAVQARRQAEQLKAHFNMTLEGEK